MTIRAVLKATQRSQSPYGCFQSEWLANGDCRSRFGDVPRQEMAGHGDYWRRKIPKNDNWWRKQPYLHSEPFLKKIILKKTTIWTKFQKQGKAKQNPCWVLNCCYILFKGKKFEVSTRRRAALTQSFPLARSDTVFQHEKKFDIMLVMTESRKQLWFYLNDKSLRKSTVVNQQSKRTQWNSILKSLYLYLSVYSKRRRESPSPLHKKQRQ